MFTKALSHRQKVLRLYKRALRECDAWYGGDHLEVRYHKVLMRARFDANAQEKDIRQAKLLLADGCREIWQKRHPKPYRFAADFGGVAYDRDRESRDILLDTDSWSYVEREQYPYYFNKREQRKKELLSHWDKIDEAWNKQIDNIQRTPPKYEDKKTEASKRS